MYHKYKNKSEILDFLFEACTASDKKMCDGFLVHISCSRWNDNNLINMGKD